MWTCQRCVQEEEQARPASTEHGLSQPATALLAARRRQAARLGHPAAHQPLVHRHLRKRIGAAAVGATLRLLHVQQQQLLADLAGGERGWGEGALNAAGL